MSLLTGLLAFLAFPASKGEKIDLTENDRLDLAALLIDARLEAARATERAEQAEAQAANLTIALNAARRITELARSVAADVALERDRANGQRDQARAVADLWMQAAHMQLPISYDPNRQPTARELAMFHQAQAQQVVDFSPQRSCTCVPARHDAFMPGR